MSYWIKAYHIVQYRIPKWVVFKSFIALFLAILLLLIVLLFLPFQDKVSGTIEIFSSGRPIELLTAEPGRLYLHANNGDRIKKGEIIATVQFESSPDKIEAIQDFIFVELSNITSGNLGSINNKLDRLVTRDGHALNAALISLQEAIDQYRRSLQINLPEREIAAIRQLQISYSNQLPELERSALLYNRTISLTRQQLRQDSILLAQGGISRRDYEQRRIALLDDLREQLKIVSEQKKIKAQIADQEADVAALEDQYAQNSDLLFSKIQYQIENVRNAFNTTYNNQIIVSPISGQLVLNMQTVPFNDVPQGFNIGSITSLNSKQQNVAIARFTRQNTGKIEVGMPSIIYLDDYPAKEYGMVRAEVKDINDIPTSEFLELYVDLEFPITTKLQSDNS